ncbi:LacI family transcriptional regulator [Aquisalinus flavus]|nr:LacI family transcriptional regulator [Aquisalinus flavus]
MLMSKTLPRPVTAETTMFEIAQLAGVSESTVSRALSGSPLVNENTRNRILKIARSANYTVNINARNLRQKRTRTIEVLIPLAEYGRQHMSDPFYLDMLGVLADALSERHYDMLLTKRAPWAKGVETNSIQCGRADGIIIMGQGQDLEALRNFTDLYPQVVVWGGHLREDDYIVVGTDNVAGGKLATEHLMKLGRKRIAFLGDPAEPEIALRQQGYRKAFLDNGIAVDESLIFSAPFDAREARASAEKMLQSGVSFDAIFCASDVIAMSAITTLRNAGLDVPRDVAIVGYDDILIANSFGPSLTTVSQRIQEGGKTMVELLLQRIEGKSVDTTLLPVELVVRESCGAP